jgi:hypothetical protein
MFVQVIQGHVTDAAAAKARMETWKAELAPGAVGWLGSTAGVTEDGTFVAMARFDSEEAARRNSERPEQTAWWEETRRMFTGDPEFHDSEHVDVDLVGDPDTAGFVQIMEGRTTDPARMREMMSDESVDLHDFRPDVLGSLTVQHDGDAYTMALYFTSEQDARENERKEPPPELEAMFKEMDSLEVGETAYLDLKEPWLDSPA